MTNEDQSGEDDVDDAQPQDGWIIPNLHLGGGILEVSASIPSCQHEDVDSQGPNQYQEVNHQVVVNDHPRKDVSLQTLEESQAVLKGVATVHKVADSLSG